MTPFGPSELVNYATKFWDAANTAVTLIYGVAFAVYVLIAQYPDVRRMIKDYYLPIIVFSSIGNTMIGVLIVRLWWLESSILEEAGAGPLLVSSIFHACIIRVILVAFNFAMYVAVLHYVKVNPIKRLLPDGKTIVVDSSDVTSR